MIKGEPVYVNGDGEPSRDFCYIDNVRQINLLAASSENPEAANQVYNVAVGDRTTLNQLYEQLHLNLLPSFPTRRERNPFIGISAQATCATRWPTSARRPRCWTTGLLTG